MSSAHVFAPRSLGEHAGTWVACPPHEPGAQSPVKIPPGDAVQESAPCHALGSDHPIHTPPNRNIAAATRSIRLMSTAAKAAILCPKMGVSRHLVATSSMLAPWS